MSNNSDRLSKASLLAYASPSLPIAAMGVPLAVYLPPFYAQDMGLGLSIVGLLFMLARMWDVVTDPMLGVLSDRFPSRWGRRRHWIALSVPIMLLATWKLFMPDQENVTPFYLVFWLFILYIAWTLLSLTHQAWGAELTGNYDERSRIQGTREMLLLVGAIIVLALPSVIEQMKPENVGVARVAAMGWMVVLLLPVTVLWACVKVGERKSIPVDTRMSWRETARAIKNNRPLQRLLFSGLAFGLSQGMTGALLIFLTTDVLKLGEWFSIVLLIYFFCGIFYIPFFAYVSEQASKHVSLSISALLYGLGINLLWFIPVGGAIPMAVTMALISLSMGVVPFLHRSILADVVDHDTVNTGKERTGLFYALYNMVDKIGAAIAIGITYIVLDMIGFLPGQENSASTLQDFKVLFIVPTVFLMAFIAFIMRRFPIDKTQQEQNQKILSTATTSADDQHRKNSLVANLNT